MNFVESLIVASEKAANIARACRQDQHLFNLLVQEKNSVESNPRFVHDFKTLADVLIQETLKYDVGQQFLEVKDFISGEESNIFCNTLGHTIKVEVLRTIEATRDLLSRVLNSDDRAATLLAEEVHKKINVADVNTDRNVPAIQNLELNELGIWIDPIDSTSEYINGKETIDPNNISLTGLRCVTVLIGVYNRLTGYPLIGVVNQPFHEENNGIWRGKCYWGVNTNLSSLPPMPMKSNESNLICVSNSEDEAIKLKLQRNGYNLIEAAGAGYKLLLVVLGLADAYVLTKSSTFKWDTCAPQAILNQSGGDLIIWDEAIGGKTVPIEYKDNRNSCDKENKINKYCNYGGIIAYRNSKILTKILEILHQ